ncbi:MAG TPA: hypothetical protein DEA40_08235, partial [Parvularcula sp.]|nr:hypothetical protein [Parvularcula sp.]
MATITIEPVSGPKGRRDFIRAGKVAYAGDPHFVAPLEFEVGARLDPGANPALKGADVQLFIAKKDGAVAGRISAFVNPLHLERYQDATGHFGFLDAVDDAAVFSSLLKAAEEFFRARGLQKCAGPFSFSVNEECGLLVSGFDTPPYIMMPHGRPWYQRHVEAAGYVKAMDMHAL